MDRRYAPPSPARPVDRRQTASPQYPHLPPTAASPWGPQPQAQPQPAPVPLHPSHPHAHPHAHPRSRPHAHSPVAPPATSSPNDVYRLPRLARPGSPLAPTTSASPPVLQPVPLHARAAPPHAMPPPPPPGYGPSPYAPAPSPPLVMRPPSRPSSVVGSIMPMPPPHPAARTRLPSAASVGMAQPPPGMSPPPTAEEPRAASVPIPGASPPPLRPTSTVPMRAEYPQQRAPPASHPRSPPGAAMGSPPRVPPVPHARHYSGSGPSHPALPPKQAIHSYPAPAAPSALPPHAASVPPRSVGSPVLSPSAPAPSSQASAPTLATPTSSTATARADAMRMSSILSSSSTRPVSPSTTRTYPASAPVPVGSGPNLSQTSGYPRAPAPKTEVLDVPPAPSSVAGVDPAVEDLKRHRDSLPPSPTAGPAPTGRPRAPTAPTTVMDVPPAPVDAGPEPVVSSAAPVQPAAEPEVSAPEAMQVGPSADAEAAAAAPGERASKRARLSPPQAGQASSSNGKVAAEEPAALLNGAEAQEEYFEDTIQPRDLALGPARVDSEHVWLYLDRCDKVELERRRLEAKAARRLKRLWADEPPSGASTPDLVDDEEVWLGMFQVGLRRGRPAPHLGWWQYDPDVQPLLPGDLLRAHVGATLEVRISGELLGPGPAVGDTPDTEDPTLGWRLGWRGREHARTLRELKRSVVNDAPTPPVSTPPASVSAPKGETLSTLRSLAPLDRRQVWGTDVYTDDSDVLGMCIHAGWVEFPGFEEGKVPAWVPPGQAQREWAQIGSASGEQPAVGGGADKVNEPAVAGEGGPEASAAQEGTAGPDAPAPPPRRTCDLSVMLRIAPRLIVYRGCPRSGISSRSWGNTHDGVSLVIEGVELTEPGHAHGPGRAGRKRRLATRAAESTAARRAAGTASELALNVPSNLLLLARMGEPIRLSDLAAMP